MEVNRLPRKKKGGRRRQVGKAKRKSYAKPKRRLHRRVHKKSYQSNSGLNPKRGYRYSKSKDKKLYAKKPGKRRSKRTGKVYYEWRKNRSDKSRKARL